MTPVIRCIPVAPDVALNVRVWPGGGADEAGTPVLCVHGLASNARTWDGVAARLSDLGRPVAAVDLRGHGRSDKPDDGYDFATFTADLVTVLDVVGWERAVVAGQSTGGNLVVDLAARAPERVEGVAGVDGGVIDLQRRWPAWEDCAAALAPPRLEGTPRSAIQAHLRRAHPDWPDEGIEASLANFDTLDDGTVRPWLTFERHLRILRALWEHRPSTVLARVRAPVLLVVADTGDDWAVAKRAEVDLATTTGPGPVDVVWFSPADHDVHVQHPVEVAGLMHERLN